MVLEHLRKHKNSYVVGVGLLAILGTSAFIWNVYRDRTINSVTAPGKSVVSFVDERRGTGFFEITRYLRVTVTAHDETRRFYDFYGSGSLVNDSLDYVEVEKNALVRTYSPNMFTDALGVVYDRSGFELEKRVFRKSREQLNVYEGEYKSLLTKSPDVLKRFSSS